MLFIGAHNDGSCANLVITDELLLNLASMRSDGNITPFPTMAVQKRMLNRCELAVVTVEPADAPPFVIEGASGYGLVHARRLRLRKKNGD